MHIRACQNFAVFIFVYTERVFEIYENLHHLKISRYTVIICNTSALRYMEYDTLPLFLLYTLGYIIYVNNCAFPPPDNVRFHSSFEFHSSFGFHGFHWFHSLWTGFLHSSFEFRSSFEFHWSGFYTSSEFLYLSFGFYSSLDFHTLCKCRPIMRYIKHLCVG